MARWGLGLLFALGVHISVAIGVMTWKTNTTPPPLPSSAVLIELAALPAAPPVKSSEAPPEVKPPPKPEPKPKPEPESVEPPPLQEVKPEPEPVPEIESAVEPEVALPKPPPVQEKTPPPEPVSKPLPPKTTAPPTESLPLAPQAEPMPEISPAQRAQAVQSWNAMLLAHLSRYKRYPSSAKRRQYEGIVYLWFVMDREGRVLSARIERGSGYALLDEEARAMIRRAEPLPAPPPEVPGERVVRVVPVDFSLVY